MELLIEVKVTGNDHYNKEKFTFMNDLAEFIHEHFGIADSIKECRSDTEYSADFYVSVEDK